MATKRPAIQRDWFTKTMAGLLLGLVLAFGISGIVSELTSSVPLVVRAQLVMWLVAPVWLVIFASVYFFRSGARAWLWLGAASALVHGAFFALKAL